MQTATFTLFSDARIMERVHERAMNVTITLKGAIRENGLWSWIMDMYVLRAGPLTKERDRTKFCVQVACTIVCILAL